MSGSEHAGYLDDLNATGRVMRERVQIGTWTWTEEP